MEIVVTVRPHNISTERKNGPVHRLREELSTTSRNGQLSKMGKKECSTGSTVGQKLVALSCLSTAKARMNPKDIELEKRTSLGTPCIDILSWQAPMSTQLCRVLLFAVVVRYQLTSFRYPGETVNGPETVMNFLLRLPYDVRRDIYDFFYPTGKNIQLTNGLPEWNALTPRRGAHRVTSNGLNLLLACRELNHEIKQLLYGKNTFLVAAGGRNFPNPRSLRQPYANSRLFLSNLLRNTKQMAKTLHLCLGPSLHRNFNGKLPGQLAGFRQIVVTVDPLNLISPASRMTKQQCIRDACRWIAAARAGLPPDGTLWDDCGGAATARMLDEVMPYGYSSVV